MSAESCLTLETLDHTIANHSSLMHRRFISAFLSIRESHGGVLARGEAWGNSTTPAVIPALASWPLGCLECVLISIGAQELTILIDCQVLLVLGDLIGARSTLDPVGVVSWPGRIRVLILLVRNDLCYLDVLGDRLRREQLCSLVEHRLQAWHCFCWNSLETNIILLRIFLLAH